MDWLTRDAALRSGRALPRRILRREPQDDRVYLFRAPRLGAYYATWVLPCAFWPAEPTPAAHAPLAADAPPILVIGATLDSQDPFQWSVDMAAQLESGLLLTRDGPGHPSYLLSSCVEDAVNAFLIDLTLPKPGMVCPSTHGLFERFG